MLRSLPREGKGQELFPGYHVSPAFRGRFASPGFLLSKFVSFKVSELGTSKAGGSASSQTSNVSFDWYLPSRYKPGGDHDDPSSSYKVKC